MIDYEETTIYECTRNTDQTEGRGHMVAFAWTDSLDEAINIVRGQGVMGVGDGEVNEITTTGIPGSRGSRKTVYGYHCNWQGQWVHGLFDDVDPPADEIEDYKAYLRLQKKFGR